MTKVMLFFSCSILLGFATCGNRQSTAALAPGPDSAVADSPTAAEPAAELPPPRRVYDTVRYTDEESLPLPAALLEDLPEEAAAEAKRSAQYRIWQRRRQAMQRWAVQYRPAHLPEGARIIETKAFRTSNGLRTILAWMNKPAAKLELFLRTDEYTCPDIQYGSGYFQGRLFFSLLDGKGALINTIAVRGEPQEYQQEDTLFYDGAEHLIYPFAIANPAFAGNIAGLLYHASGGSDTADGEAEILHLFDFNGDGKAHEFFLATQIGCAFSNTTLIGYNEKTDRLRWYEWELKILEDENGPDTALTRTAWMGHTLRMRFERNGKLNYEMDYRGRGGTLNRYSLRYDRKTDSYSGLLDKRQHPEDTGRDMSWMPVPVQSKE